MRIRSLAGKFRQAAFGLVSLDFAENIKLAVAVHIYAMQGRGVAPKMPAMQCDGRP